MKKNFYASLPCIHLPARYIRSRTNVRMPIARHTSRSPCHRPAPSTRQRKARAIDSIYPTGRSAPIPHSRSSKISAPSTTNTIYGVLSMQLASRLSLEVSPETPALAAVTSAIYYSTSTTTPGSSGCFSLWIAVGWSTPGARRSPEFCTGRATAAVGHRRADRWSPSGRGRRRSKSFVRQWSASTRAQLARERSTAPSQATSTGRVSRGMDEAHHHTQESGASDPRYRDRTTKSPKPHQRPRGSGTDNDQSGLTSPG